MQKYKYRNQNVQIYMKKTKQNMQQTTHLMFT